MKLQQSNTTRILASVTMMLLVSTVFLNKALYIHTHVMTNGQLITHSHPYNKTQDSAPIKSHKHSKIEIYTFHQHDLLSLGSIIFLAITLYGTLTLSVNFIEIKYEFQTTNFIKSRAPPSFM